VRDGEEGATGGAPRGTKTGESKTEVGGGVCAVMLNWRWSNTPFWSKFLVETHGGADPHCGGFLAVCGSDGVKPTKDHPQNASEEYLRQAALLTVA